MGGGGRGGGGTSSSTTTAAAATTTTTSSSGSSSTLNVYQFTGFPYRFLLFHLLYETFSGSDENIA
jgi:hypothetical protein